MQRSMMGLWGAAMTLSLALSITACGGSAGGTSGSTPSFSGGAGGTVAANELPVVIDAGPAELVTARIAAVNALYASVTLCAAGTSTCQTIDHVLVDTGSVGLRLLASELTAFTPTAATDVSSGAALRGCQQFLDGHTWGSVVIADVQLGSKRISSMPVHLIGDAAAGAVPAGCGVGRSLSSVVALKARGILGVGSFLQDCGTYCATGAREGGYYICPLRAGVPVCQPVAVALSRQVPNPVSVMSSDNNGLVLKLPSVPSGGAKTVNGSLFFGIGTQTNNSLGGAQLFTLDDNGTFATIYSGVTANGSFIDSGSNGYFFNANFPRCTTNSSFYCPPVSRSETAQMQGLNGQRATITFTVANADPLFAAQGNALPGLAGTFDGGASGGPFDWGLPFFFGRSVFVLFEKSTLGTTTGPAVGF